MLRASAVGGRSLSRLATRASPLRSAARSVSVTTCDDESQFATAKKSEHGAVVYFTASWCGPCKMISPIFEAVAESKSSSTFLKVDVDEMQEVAAEAGISAMPTFQFYKGGEKVGQIVGADPNALKDGADEHLS